MKQKFWVYLQVFCFVAGAVLWLRNLFFNTKND